MATPAYAAVLQHHDWAGTAKNLVRLSPAGREGDMPPLISDAMLETFAMVGLMKGLPAKLTERYGGLVDAVNVAFGPPYAQDRTYPNR